MDLINAKFTCAWDLGQLDARFCPYHYDFRHYVGLAGRVMRVCRQQSGGAQALTYVSGFVEQAAVLSARVFVRGFRDLEEKWGYAQSSRRVLVSMGMVFLRVVILCT